MHSDFTVERLRRKPVSYTITVTHFAEGENHASRISIEGVGMDTKERRDRVVDDLKWAAKEIRANKGTLYGT